MKKKIWLGMATGLFIFGMTGMASASVIDHIAMIEMSKTHNYKSTSGSTFRYQFDAALLADDTVDSIFMKTPGDSVYALAPEVDNGENWFSYGRSSSNAAGLADLTSGLYTFTVNYKAGGADLTTVMYALPNGDPIPPVTQRPVLHYPADGAVGVPNLMTFKYGAPTGSNWTVGLEWEATTGSDEGHIEGLPFNVSSFGPVALALDTEYEVVMSINHVIFGPNADGIQSVVDTDSEELFTFTTATAVPLPSTMIFFGSGLAGLSGLRIRKKLNGRVGSSWGRAKLTD